MANNTKWVELLLEIPAPANQGESFHAQSEHYVRRVKDLCTKWLSGWTVLIRSALGPSGDSVQVDLVFGPDIDAADKQKAAEAAHKAIHEADTQFVTKRKTA